MHQLMPVLLAAVLLAGCFGKATEPPVRVHVVQPAPVYRLLLRLVREAADGTPLPDAEVYAVPEAEAAADPGKLPAPRFSDDRGEVAFLFPHPVTLLVQAFGPGKGGGGWTREGMRLVVGDNVTSDRELSITGHTVVLPLLHAQRSFTLNGTWGPAVATLAANGSIVPATQTFDVPLAPAYLARLSNVRLDLTWQQDTGAFGDLYAGLVRDGAILRGTDTAQLPTPGPAVESVAGMPTGAGPLKAVALTDRAVVGALGLHVSGTLQFSGRFPSQLPVPDCLSEACAPLPIHPA